MERTRKETLKTGTPQVSVYVIAYNDEPNMQACLESVAGWGDELAVASVATDPARIAAALGVPNVDLFDPRRNTLLPQWRPLEKGVVPRLEVPACEKCISEARLYWYCSHRPPVGEVTRQVRQVIEHGTSALRVLHV
jgi:hypothetical protein